MLASLRSGKILGLPGVDFKDYLVFRILVLQVEESINQTQLKTIRSLVALEINFHDLKSGEQRG